MTASPHVPDNPFQLRACALSRIVRFAVGKTLSEGVDKGTERVFSIVINEKGGAERTESFDKSEINIGRVHNNDLMLPKGNVSKHHARLLFRDGRFIFTDLKSTNGTYVNGRKIAQATVVREGDKIYIGDFVLRIELGEGSEPSPSEGRGRPASASASDIEPIDDESMHTSTRESDNVQPSPNQASGPTKAPPLPAGAAPRPQPPPVPSHASNASPASRPGTRGDELEESVKSPRLVNVPPLPGQAGQALGRPATMPLNQSSPPALGSRSSAVQSAPSPSAPAVLSATAASGASSASATAGRGPEPPPLPATPGLPASPPRAVASTTPPAIEPAAISPPRAPMPVRRIVPKDPSVQAAQRLAMTTLLGRVAETVDLSALRTSPIVSDALAAQIEQAANEAAKAMRDEGKEGKAHDVDLESIGHNAHRELVGLGALEPLLSDEEVVEIHCVRFGQVFAMRGSPVATEVTEEFGFSSEEALERVIARLVHQSGESLRLGESVVERRLDRASFVAISPPFASNHVLTVRKLRRAETTLDELVHKNSLSRPMAQFLEACVDARANILVAGASCTSTALAALAAAGAPGEHVVVVHDGEEIGVGSAQVVNLPSDTAPAGGEEAVHAAAALGPDRLLVGRLTGSVAAATLDAITRGEANVFAAVPATSLRQGVARVVAQLVLYRHGVAIDAIREMVGEAFDIAIEVAPFADGRMRMIRIAELTYDGPKGLILRDLFVFTPDASGVDGTFAPSGVVPRIATDFASRGVRLDASLFKRTSR